MTENYSFGMEEEYFIVDAETKSLQRKASPAFLSALKRAIGPAVTREMLQSQLEISTKPALSMAAGHAELKQLRYVGKRDPADLVGNRAITVGELLDHQGPCDNPAIRTAPFRRRTHAVKTQFADALPHVRRDCFFFVPPQDVGEDLAPDESTRQVANC